MLQGQDESSEADPLDIINCEGCFWVTIYGTIFSVVLVLIEHFVYLVKVTIKTKLPFREVFSKEMKVYLDFNSESKPVLAKEDASEDKSKSESAKESEKSKTTAKSSLRSRSMSPRRRMSKSKSARRASHSKSVSKSNGNKSPLPYGFIFSRSTERLQATP